MGKEIPAPSGFAAWGPFVRDNYQTLRVTQADIIVAGIAFALANLFGLSAAFIAVRHTKASRQPWRSIYIWMIWLELAASVALSIICLLYLLRIIRPSFYFFMGVLVCWVVQIQLLPQIIVNRIRIILQDRKRGKRLVAATATVITLINISVFCIWIPSRLQISERWIKINAGWDRTEKVLFLLLDGYLNWYFIRTVTAELVKNGLTKYNRLVRFNKRIIVVSLLLDVMIISAMSIPNGFVYAMFHPLAYLVKLNIEMSMAHLIRVIALDNRRPSEDPSLLLSPPSSPEINTFNASIYAEVPRPRRSLIRGLFSSEHVVFPHEEVRARVPKNISEQSTTVPEFELPHWKPRLSKESGRDAIERTSLHAVLSNTTVHRESIREDSGVSQGDVVAAEAQNLNAPDPVVLPARTSEAG